VQRTHTLLAFFDLLACLRRQNVAGIANETDIYDLTEVGKHDFQPASDVVQSFSWQDDPKRASQKRLVIKHNQTKKQIFISGKPIQKKWVRQEGSSLLIKGWLAMNNGLTNQALRPAYEALQKWLPGYLELAEIASRPFRNHRTYPFFAIGNTLPGRLLHRFGNREWHSSKDNYSYNWLATYRHIDWMLQGNQEATTLTVHYPNPDYKKPGHEK
jgi:hypothetical protein